MFDKAIIQKIMESWTTDAADFNREPRHTPVIFPEDVEFLVETAFLTSLKKEEDRPVSFSLVFLSRKNVAVCCGDPNRKQLVMSFSRPLALTVDNLSKVAMAFDPSFTSFVVAPVDDARNRYEIWGVMFFNALPNYFDDIPESAAGEIAGDVYRRPDVFMITSVTPGSLIISKGDSQIGRFAAGKFIKATPSPFYSRAMGNFLFNKIKRDAYARTNDREYWKVFIHSLDYLLSEISSKSHGGSVLIVPEQKLSLYSDYFTPKYTFLQNLEIHELILASLTIDDQSNSAALKRLGFNRQISERLQVLAQLAAVDGALILSGSLQILSFGVTLKAPKYKGKVLEGPDGYTDGNAVFNHHILGTRHNSMIDFIAKCPDSIGFVISQDGPIRGLVRKNAKTLYCWPDCRVSMFI